MAQEPALVSMAQQFSGLPMQDLIGGPLMAAAEANSKMAITQTRFLLNTCFSRSGNPPDTKYSPTMVTMEITRPVLAPVSGSTDTPLEKKISQVTTEFKLPLLTILPLNSLAVDDVSIAFHMEVKSCYSDDNSEKSDSQLQASASYEEKMDLGIFSTTVKGSVSYNSSSSSSHDTHYEKSNSAEYDVKVHAGQLPLPQGVTTIIQAYTNSLGPVTMPTEASGS